VYKLDTVKLANINIRVYGSTAIMNGDAEIKETYQGQSWESKIMVTQVWLKRNNKWQVVSEHASRKQD
jgi:hypothetical protein